MIRKRQIIKIILSWIAAVFKLTKQDSRHDGRAWFGWAYGHIQAFGLTLFPHKRIVCTEGM